uniref:Uncharacterized protein n=1 Tax=Arundo donax TaxID=35708 RepID=A0A0A9B7T7_ARUDO
MLLLYILLLDASSLRHSASWQVHNLIFPCVKNEELCEK